MTSLTSSVGSISPMTSPMDSEGTRAVWIEPQRQIDAYMAWVNSQLKKKPGVHLIEDLRNDMRDGVVFADIIEIVAKERIAGIHEVPATYEEMRHNIDLVLQFMTSNRIRMHRISSRDIVEGNLKAVMRLILALAAHYKPMSVRHSNHSSSSRPESRRQSVMDIAQGASAALTEARRNAKKAGKRSSRCYTDHRYQESSSEPCSDSDGQSYLRPDWRLQPMRRELEGCSAGTSPASSCGVSPRSSLHLPDGCPSSLEMAGKDGDTLSIDSGLDDSHMEALKALKRQLLQLQDLMLGNGCDADAAASVMALESPTAESLMLLKSQVQHTSVINEELREELSRIKNECLQLQGTKAGLMQRLNEQDSVLSQLKSDKLRLEIELQTVTSENESLRREMSTRTNPAKAEQTDEEDKREQSVLYLREELGRRDRMISKLQQEVSQQSFVHREGKPVSLRPKSVGHLELKGKEPQQMEAEVSFLQDSLQKMLTTLSVPTLDPSSLDLVEKRILTILQSLKAARHPPPSAAASATPLSSSGLCEPGERSRHMYNQSPVPKLRPTSLHSSASKAGMMAAQAGDGPRTSVIFFADNSIQPDTCLLPGRLGEITLRDFKRLFEECEHYRYYFKALDPEYGTVKEELTKDDAVIPGWEDKIVAWVESESGTPF